MTARRRQGEGDEERGGNDLGQNVVAEIGTYSSQYAVFAGKLTDGNAGVIQQGADKQRNDQQKQILCDEQYGVRAYHLVNLSEGDSQSIPHQRESLSHGEDHDRDQNHDDRDQIHTDRGDCLDDDVLGGCHRQREGQIALRGKEVFIKPNQCHDEGKSKGSENGNGIGQDREGADDLVGCAVVFEEEDHSGGSSDGQQDDVHDAHDPSIGEELVLKQLLYHLNTSLNSSSTLFSCSVRICSAVFCRTMLPFRRKMTSSRIFSMSVIR